MAVAPLNKVREVLEYALTQIPPEKILMGIPNYGYDWILPYVKGESKARKITNNEALEIAAKYNAEIEFDEIAMSPYFIYFDEEEREHEVWFENETSIRAKFSLINEYDLAGLSYWNSMSYYEPNSLVLNEMFDVIKDENVLMDLLREMTTVPELFLSEAAETMSNVTGDANTISSEISAKVNTKKGGASS